MKKIKKYLFTWKALAIVLALILFAPIIVLLPLVLSIFFAIKLYRNRGSSSKNRTIGKGILLILFGLFFTVPWVNMLPETEDVNKKVEATSPPIVQDNAEIEVSNEQEQVTKDEIDPDNIIANSEKALFIRVVDGDTLEVEVNGQREKVRIIGINTPETVDPRKSVECFGEEATRMAKLSFEDEDPNIYLESDPSQGDRDKYNRLLRYVWQDDASTDYGRIMILLGYAYEYTYNKPYKYQNIYKEAQKQAENEKKGLWADGVCEATPAPTVKTVATTNPTATTAPSTGYTGGYQCDGPDLDCSDFSTHAQAQSFFDACGYSANNDPHRLDSVGVGDGVACESLP